MKGNARFYGSSPRCKSKPPVVVMDYGGFIFYSFLFLKYERTAITVHIIVATHVTVVIIKSHVISKPPVN